VIAETQEVVNHRQLGSSGLLVQSELSELELGHSGLPMSLAHGPAQARLTAGGETSSARTTLDGEVDPLTHASLTISLLVVDPGVGPSQYETTVYCSAPLQ
jgi:hypothetical protein